MKIEKQKIESKKIKMEKNRKFFSFEIEIKGKKHKGV